MGRVLPTADLLTEGMRSLGEVLEMHVDLKHDHSDLVFTQAVNLSEEANHHSRTGNESGLDFHGRDPSHRGLQVADRDVAQAQIHEQLLAEVVIAFEGQNVPLN